MCHPWSWLELDMNSHGIFTISDVLAWIRHIFFSLAILQFFFSRQREPTAIPPRRPLVGWQRPRCRDAGLRCRPRLSSYRVAAQQIRDKHYSVPPRTRLNRKVVQVS